MPRFAELARSKGWCSSDNKKFLHVLTPHGSLLSFNEARKLYHFFHNRKEIIEALTSQNVPLMNLSWSQIKAMGVLNDQKRREAVAKVIDKHVIPNYSSLINEEMVEEIEQTQKVISTKKLFGIARNEYQSFLTEFRRKYKDLPPELMTQIISNN